MQMWLVIITPISIVRSALPNSKNFTLAQGLAMECKLHHGNPFRNKQQPTTNKWIFPWKMYFGITSPTGICCSENCQNYFTNVLCCFNTYIVVREDCESSNNTLSFPHRHDSNFSFLSWSRTKLNASRESSKLIIEVQWACFFIGNRRFSGSPPLPKRQCVTYVWYYWRGEQSSDYRSSLRIIKICICMV